jgi:hypothetical protein
MGINEQRRSKRKPPGELVQVTNAMSGEVIGRIGNLSIDGLMLISNVPVVENGLYQFAFRLPDRQGREVHLEVGVHEQWSEPASVPGQYWSGFRIVDLAPADFEVLNAWVGNNPAR